ASHPPDRRPRPPARPGPRRPPRDQGQRALRKDRPPRRLLERWSAKPRSKRAARFPRSEPKASGEPHKARGRELEREAGMDALGCAPSQPEKDVGGWLWNGRSRS